MSFISNLSNSGGGRKFESRYFIWSTLAVTLAVSIMAGKYVSEGSGTFNLTYILLAAVYLITWLTTAFFCGRRKAKVYLIMALVLWIGSLIYIAAVTIDTSLATYTEVPQIDGTVVVEPPKPIPFYLIPSAALSQLTAVPTAAMLVLFAGENFTSISMLIYYIVLAAAMVGMYFAGVLYEKYIFGRGLSKR